MTLGHTTSGRSVVAPDVVDALELDADAASAPRAAPRWRASPHASRISSGQIESSFSERQWMSHIRFGAHRIH